MKDTSIAWCDSSVNPVRGCGGGIDGFCEIAATCYARRIHNRFRGPTYPEPFHVIDPVPGRMKSAADWPDLRCIDRRSPAKPWLNGLPRVIFIEDMGDLFSPGVPADYIVSEVFEAIRSPAGSRHVWVLCTKQPWRMLELSKHLEGVRNVVYMVTITGPKHLDRLEPLLEIPDACRALSLEPLLEPLTLPFDDWCEPLRRGDGSLDQPIAWVIVGGESGPNARPMDPEWVTSIRQQCCDYMIPFFFKQWGGRALATGGRMLDGRLELNVPRRRFLEMVSE